MPDRTRDIDDEPKLLGTWITLQQAELMLQHLRAAGDAWPEAAIYLHSCITAIRSVTFTMQYELADAPGFRESYEIRKKELADDSEMAYLKEARNHVLKRGSLHLRQAYSLKYDGPWGSVFMASGRTGLMYGFLIQITQTRGSLSTGENWMALSLRLPCALVYSTGFTRRPTGR